jgi:aspartate aminotransferase-like enzyme
MLEEFGWEKRFKSIALMAQTFETACKGMGLDLFVREKQFRSPALTSVTIPSDKVHGIKEALGDLGIVVSEGQGEGETCLRFAHYSPGGWPEISLLAGSLFGAAKKCGLRVKRGFIEEAWKTWEGGGR